MSGSTAYVPRGKGRNMYAAGTRRTRASISQLRKPQTCFVCTELLNKDDWAYWSTKRRKWRHPRCPDHNSQYSYGRA